MWKTKKQVVIAKSSNEAEYLVMTNGCFELLWLRILLEEMGFKQGGLLVCYSFTTIKLAKNPVYHEKIKHVGGD